MAEILLVILIALLSHLHAGLIISTLLTIEANYLWIKLIELLLLALPISELISINWSYGGSIILLLGLSLFWEGIEGLEGDLLAVHKTIEVELDCAGTLVSSNELPIVLTIIIDNIKVNWD